MFTRPKLDFVCTYRGDHLVNVTLSYCVLHHCTGFFVFSSRRRHTRCLSDWSSDVCSSDLADRLPLVFRDSPPPPGWAYAILDASAKRVAGNAPPIGPPDLIDRLCETETPGLHQRSEERRVGKEGRRRRGRSQYDVEHRQ